jgi:hypothetical protein
VTLESAPVISAAARIDSFGSNSTTICSIQPQFGGGQRAAFSHKVIHQFVSWKCLLSKVLRKFLGNSIIDAAKIVPCGCSAHTRGISRLPPSSYAQRSPNSITGLAASRPLSPENPSKWHAGIAPRRRQEERSLELARLGLLEVDPGLNKLPKPARLTFVCGDAAGG